MVEGRAVASALVFRAFLPPHPALSLGERENRRPLRGESNARDRAGVSASNRGAHGASGSEVRIKQDAGSWFPLPAGEGKGEGEPDAANQNGRTNFASSARTTSWNVTFLQRTRSSSSRSARRACVFSHTFPSRCARGRN